MFFRQMLMSGATRLFAPEDDGAEFEDPDIDLEEEQEPDDQDDEDPADEPEEPEDLDDPDPDPEPAPTQRAAPQRKPFSQRVNEVAERKAAEIVQRELAAFRAQQQAQANQPPQETPAQLQQRLAEMEPYERAEFIAQQTARNVEQQMAAMRWDAQESADKTSFDALCNREPAAAKLKDAVEARLATMRAAGTTVNRETLYTHMLGERARASASRSSGKAQRAADTNRQRQTTRAPQGRGDTPASDDRRGNNLAAIEKRLLNVQL